MRPSMTFRSGSFGTSVGSPPLVKEVVQRWVRSFEGARVTVYLPIMIERASRDELSHLAAQPALGDGPG